MIFPSFLQLSIFWKKKMFSTCSHLALWEHQKFPILFSNFQKYFKKFSFSFSKMKTRKLRYLHWHFPAIYCQFKNFSKKRFFLLAFCFMRTPKDSRSCLKFWEVFKKFSFSKMRMRKLRSFLQIGSTNNV